MTIHYWGDKDFDWEALNKAIDLIYWWSRYFGRFGGQIKEKWGCLRFYAFFSDGTLYSICKPGYYWVSWPKWLYRLDTMIFKWVIVNSGLIRLIHKWQYFIYRLAYEIAVKKYPHIRKEILQDADYKELLKNI